MMRSIPLSTALLLFGFAAYSEAIVSAGEAVQATAAQHVHPVLIRKEHNALLHVALDVKQANVRAKSFTFSLAGTDDTNDVESLALFSTGEKTSFSPENRVGEQQRTGKEVSFNVDVPLDEGKNVFWLSCRLKDDADLSHRVDAACTAIETSAGTVVPRDDSPGVRKRIGVALRRHMDDGVDTYRIPALATTPEGTLLCVYDMRRRKSRDLQEDIDIGLSRSTDGGQTWEPPRVIMDMGEYNGLPQEQNGCSDPGIVVDQATGKIFAAAVWMWGKPGKHQWSGDGSEPGYEIGKSAQFLMVSSDDDGLTWSMPENLTRKLKKEKWWLFAPSPQQGITLRDGTLVMPSQGRDEEGRPFSTIMTSQDHGATWEVGAIAGPGNSECQAVQLSDGSIMLNARCERPTKFRCVYVTDDLGQTWRYHETHQKSLIEPNCNGSLYRMAYTEDGQLRHILLFANPHSQEGRHHHTIQVSFDEGKTWPQKYHLLLDHGIGRGYPSLTQVDENHIGIVYEGSQSDLVFEKLSLGELLHR